MHTLHGTFTIETNFFETNNAYDLIAQYGSPLYVYNENILRSRCKDMKHLVSYENFVPHYSIKANTNIHLLKIVHEEGLHADVMSPGEIFLALKSGFKPEELFFIPNNVVAEDMKYAIEHGITTSVDSLDQLKLYGKLNPGGKVAIRFNPGVGAGHHEKVVTGGKKTKFGVNPEYIPEVKRLLETYHLTLVGINQHIGSLFMDSKPYIESLSSILKIAKAFDDLEFKRLLETYHLTLVGINQHIGSLFMDSKPYIESLSSILKIAKAFDDLEFIDLGGGFGIPYHKQDGEARLNIKMLGEALDPILHNFAEEYGKKVQFQIEPGRYIPCEAGLLLGQITGTKTNAEYSYLGCDIGFNALQRPIMYDSHHDIEIYSQEHKESTLAPFTVVGNICESGDILAKDRMLPQSTSYGDLIAIMDAGAYGYSMASCYNQRFRPAEVLISTNGWMQVLMDTAWLLVTINALDQLKC